jgi:transcriptional regulator with XRE-family HTH domain
MDAATLIREGRRRGGLSQAALATRSGTTQSAIARLEGGGSVPNLRRVTELVRACGFDIEVRLVPVDDSDWPVARRNLALDVAGRLRQHRATLKFIGAGRRAMADARA